VTSTLHDVEARAYSPAGRRLCPQRAGSETRSPNTWLVWEQDESGRVHTPLEPVVLAATLALIPVLILEADASGAWKTASFVANWLIWAIFAVEFGLVMFVATRKGAALRAHWLDVAIVFLTIPLFGQLLSSLRLLRFARLLQSGGCGEQARVPNSIPTAPSRPGNAGRHLHHRPRRLPRLCRACAIRTTPAPAFRRTHPISTAPTYVRSVLRFQ
jgi:hypothetical protein